MYTVHCCAIGVMLVHDIHWRLISDITQSVICGTVMKHFCSAATTILLERMYLCLSVRHYQVL